MKNSLKIAIAQFKPVYGDLKRNIDQTLQIIHEAAAKQAKIVVFGECWIGGYPAWIDHCSDVARWNNEAIKELYAQLHENSLIINSKEFLKISETVQQLGLIVVLGANEVVGKGIGTGTIYNSLLIFNVDGSLAVHHRKLTPTFNEKLLYGGGDGYGLQTLQSSMGSIGGLICWEHWMPLTRQALHNDGEDIHVACWPAVNDLHVLASRHYAVEGRCIVIAAGQIMQVKDIPASLLQPEDFKSDPDKFLLRGGSCVIDPTGEFITPPVYNEEKIIYSEIPDKKELIKERMTLDVSGHYSRFDVFSFDVNKKRI